MTSITLYILLLFLLIAAFFAVFTKNLVNSVISLSTFSAILVILFVILQAPDVALTEVVIGSGISTALFIITIDKTGGR
ncbi:Na(+)/H(+) antiporter subunit B [Orenia marismortui]|uniref:Putative MnhB-related membrane protein n=1 Tax=Orenia marismortui TaxID=46469 RepID=A0A4R8GWG6_9FIRM|nr:hydrogenase subunit MbhD domain-containing protein [Orenia marismortui]TDX48024.1 putative MnhB-related membrane protein [Orenia marismortui]